MSVEIKWKESELVTIEIDPDKLTWQHLTQFTKLQERAQAGEITESEVLEQVTSLLSTITGLDIDATPARVVNELMIELKRLSSPDGEDIKN